MNIPKTTSGKALAIVGAVFQLGLLAGCVLTELAIRRATGALLVKAEGTTDPQRISAAIGETLLPAAIGAGCGVVGIALIGVSLFRFRYRASWLFWFLIGNSICLLGFFLVGTVIGVMTLLFCLFQRHKFPAPSTLVAEPKS